MSRLSPVHHWRLSPPKLAPLSLEVESFFGISMTCWDDNGNDGGKTWPKTKDGDGLKERVELEKKGTYNMVKMKLALIEVSLEVCLSVNLPYTLGFFPHHDHFHNLFFLPHDQQILAKPSLVISPQISTGVYGRQVTVKKDLDEEEPPALKCWNICAGIGSGYF